MTFTHGEGFGRPLLEGSLSEKEQDLIIMEWTPCS